MTMDVARSGSAGYSLLPSTDNLATELGGDVAAEIAATMLISAKDSREAASEARLATEAAIAVEEREQVHEMHERADDIREAGRFKFASTVIGSGVRLAGTDPSLTDDKQRSLQIKGDFISGSGDLIAAEINFEASVHDANATRAEQISDREKRSLEGIQDTKDAAADLSRNALDLLKSVREGQSANDQNTLYLRG